MARSNLGHCWSLGVMFIVFGSSIASGHEGHQPLPTKGVQVDLRMGYVTLSRTARELLDVKTVELEAMAVGETMRAYASVIPTWSRHAFVTSRLAGRIMKLNVRPGDTVKKGQSLAEVDSLSLHSLRLDYQKAQNEFELSSSLLESVASAAKSGALPGQRLIEAESTHRLNRNSLDVLLAKATALGVAQASLDMPGEEDSSPRRLLLTSPIDGIVVHADVAIGRFVEPTEHVFEIVDTSQVWVKIGIPESDLYRVHEGQAIGLTFHGLPGRRFESKVNKIGFMLDPLTRQGFAWTEIDNDVRGSHLLPGMTGQAEFVLAGKSPGLRLPRTSVFSDGAERYVFVEESSTESSSELRKKTVVIGRRTGDSVEMISGDVFPGDRVVTQGGHQLSSLFILGVLRIGPQTAKGIGLKVESVADRVVERILRSDGAIDILPQRRTVASAQLAGSLRSIRVDRGELVKVGDVLAEVASLEFQDIQLELLQAHLDGEMWRKTLARRKDAGSAIARRVVLETESRVKSLETQFSNLREKLLSLGLNADQILEIVRTKQVLDTFPVRAPMDGIVVQFDSVLGQYLRADEPLFTIHDLSQPAVQVFLSQRDAAQIHVGQAARIRLVAFPNVVSIGRVTRLGPVLAQESRTQSAWVEFQNPSAVVLQHNMLARIALTVDRPPPTLAVPLTAIVQDGLRNFVFVQKEDATFDRRRIEVGRTDDQFVEITAGLQRGERIATSGVPQLQTAYAALR